MKSLIVNVQLLQDILAIYVLGQTNEPRKKMIEQKFYLFKAV